MIVNKMVGYSGTPLWKKLGIKERYRVLALSAPSDYSKLIEPVPDGAVLTQQAGSSVDLAHIFVTRKADLRKSLQSLRKKLRPEVPVWVSWPKKSSKVATDITEDTIREVALPLGFVDIKVCAVSEVWSGLKLVVRKELR
jgi:Protein of unknown function (DUF3052)